MIDVDLSTAHEQNFLTKTKGFDLVNFEELKKLVTSQVRQTIKRYHPNHFMPVDDIAWDCFTTLWMKGFFHKYDFTKSAKTTYLWNGVKNYLIDQERGASTRPKGISLDFQISGKTSRTLGEVLDEKLVDASVGVETYLEVLDVISPEAGGTRIRKQNRRVSQFDNGDVELSGYSVLYLTLSGYRNKEIAEKFGVSPYYVSQLYKQGVEDLKTRVDTDSMFDGDIGDCVSVLRECVHNEEEAHICPHCHSKNTRFWSDDSWSALPFYICKDCTRSFNEFTKTPLQTMQNKGRLKFIDVCRFHIEGTTVGQISVQLDLGVDKVKKYIDIYRDFFVADPEMFVLRKLTRWEGVIRKAEQRKATWKK